MQKTAVNIFISLVTIFICLILVEIGLRLFSSIGPRSGYLKPETALVNKLTPRTVTFEPNYSGMLISRDFKVPYKLNSMGFRERELDFGKLSVQKPFLFTGDSYFHGWGIRTEDRVSERFSEMLSSLGINIPVVNLAFPGFGTYQYLDVLNLYALKLNPRLIIIGFFIGNDFLDDIETLKFRQNLDTEKKSLGLYYHKIKTLIRAFLRSSPVMNLIKYSLWEIPSFRYVFDKLSIQNDRIILYKKENIPIQAEFYRSTFAALNAISQFSRTSQIPILVVIVPDDLQVLRPDLFSEYDFKKPQRMLIQHLNSLKIPYIDILDVFLSLENPQSLYFREDKHWNEKGHGVTANILGEYITRLSANK